MKKKKNEFLNQFNKEEQMILKDYFFNLEKKINFNKKQTYLFKKDFELAILYYKNKRNKNLSEIIQILSLNNLGSCYKNIPTHWYPLDNAAKIYPLSMSENWMSVFRISYYLKEDIVPELFQIALTFTMKRFPTFRTSIRKGLFWNYIDGINKRFHVYKDKMLPCSYINVSSIGKQSFKAVYYKNRISVEYFHILTDGYGGLVFISTLVNEYLRLLGKKVSFNDIVLNVDDKPIIEESTDEFTTKEKTKETKSLNDSKAIQVDGKLSNIKPCQILHFDMPFDNIKKVISKYDCSITEFILALLFIVLSYSTSKDGYIKIQVPINMRKFYPSRTLRNFSLYAVISIHKNNIKEIEYLLKEIKKQLKEQNNIENLNKIMTYTNKLVNSIKFIPLFIKKPIAREVYGYLGDKVLTTVLSNLGNVNLTDEMKREVQKMDLVLGTGITNRLLFSTITVNNVFTLSISKSTINSSVENNLYNLLIQYGINVKVHGSEIYENRK